MRALGIDTSNYTTSAAVFDGSGGYNAGRLLEVRPGELGLRQSDALFQHIKHLPGRFAELQAEGWLTGLSAVGASTRPRAVEGSYMPCFLAGEGQGRTLADALGVPFYAVSHQQGHIAAAAWSAGRLELLDRPMLAWHLSGGTTELLYVEPDGVNVRAQCVGGTSDISAGQLIDRTGVLLGLPFPAGKALDALASKSGPVRGFPVKLNGLTFSLSGMENKGKALAEQGRPPAEIARFTLETVASAVRRATDAARKRWPGLPVLCSGGVASNRLLRTVMSDAAFAGPQYSTDNAMGAAILAWRMPKGPLTGWHAAASHSDSPTWRIKTLDGADHGFARAEVEGYGGMLMSTWFDRPLSVAGRLLVRTADGVESRLVHPERALACIPNLCIHFNREANTGLNYNPQVDLQPIFGAEGGSLKDTLAAEAGGKAEDILATDLVLCITEKAQRVGLQGEYFMSGRIDDLECAYATLYGFLQGRGEEAGRGDIWVMFDNEEVGSSSRQGAQGSLMSDVLARIEESLGVTKEQSIRARTNCLLLSADNGHAIHPNHPEKSDQKLPVNMGGGVILKYNARQTYTTSGLTGAAFTAICEKAGVPVQTFANRADVAGGSTLGNLLGRQILMPMVDIGVGQLAMHSAMETASCKDAEYLANACAAYYNTPIFQPEDGQWKLGL